MSREAEGSRVTTPISPRRGCLASIRKPGAPRISHRCSPVVVGARSVIPTARTRRFASMTAIRITRRWQRERDARRFSSATVNSDRIPADRESFAAALASHKKCACSRRAMCCRRWNARFVLHGDFMAVTRRCPIDSASCAKTAPSKDSPVATPGHVALQAGDGFLVEVGGGGGYWNPLERDPERVLADARAGYVSVDAAQRDYGVVIHQRGRRYEIDFPATERLRKRGSMR